MRPVMQSVWVTVLASCCTLLEAAPVTSAYTYSSTLTSDADGPLDLVAELNYDGARTNAPIAVVMHGYSGTEGKVEEVRANAQYLRDKGFFAVSVAMRQRDGSDGIRDSGGLEIYDIYDAVEAVKEDYCGLVNPDIVYITGYSGGGGNTMAALCKFPDTFNAGAAFFGMSDYGYHATDGWYFYGAGTSRQPQLRTDIGDPSGGGASVTDRYHARASNLASANNPYTEIHLFVNADETICPPVNVTTYASNAVCREAYAGEFSNITVHIGQAGLYQDFNTNGLNEANELQSWPHGSPSANQQSAAETWFMARLLAGKIPRRALNASDSLFVAGFVKTSRFECRVGDGQQGALQLDYALSPSNMTFHAAVLSLNRQQTSRLTVDTRAFENQMVEVFLNEASIATVRGGGSWTTDTLRDGDTLELRAAGPSTLWWEDTGVMNIKKTSAWAASTLAGEPADVWLFCGTNNPGQQREGWLRSDHIGSALPTGQVTAVISSLLPATTYHVAFLATNAFTGGAMWSDVKTFATLPSSTKLLAYYDFEMELNDQGTNAYHSASFTSNGAGVTFTNQVPAALAGTSREAAYFNGTSWLRLPFLNLYGRARASGVSVSLWVKGVAGSSAWMLAEGNASNASPVYCFGPPGTDKFRAMVRRDTGSTAMDRVSAEPVFDATWHHLVWTDLAGKARLTIDGVPADASDFTYTPGTLSLNTTTLGALERRPTDSKYPFTGWIDDLSVWDEVLSTDCIRALSAGVSPLELADLLSDSAQPVRITGVSLSGTTNLSLVFTGPTLTVQPRPWYTTNLSGADWAPLPSLSSSTRTNGIYTQSFSLPATGSAIFFKIMY